MLPVYDDIQFLEQLDKGGRNKPWLVKAFVDDHYESFVLKLFHDDEDNFYTASEVYGAILAEEFDLNSPEIALFDLTGSTVLPPPQQMELEEKGYGIKFGCKYIPGSLPYTVSIHKHQIQKRIEVDRLFAFDQLINNIDRNHNRPNVLYGDEEITLIDHELAFKGLNAKGQDDITKGVAINNAYKHHFCYGLLAKGTKVSKQNYFSTFEELLSYLDISVLDSYHYQLESYGLPSGNLGDIKSFLEFAKKNHRLYVTMLKSLI